MFVYHYATTLYNDEKKVVSLVTTNKLSGLVNFEPSFAIWWKILSLTEGFIDVHKQH